MSLAKLQVFASHGSKRNEKRPVEGLFSVIFCHPSLSLFLSYAGKSLSAFDHASLVHRPMKGDGHRSGSKRYRKEPRRRLFFLALCPLRLLAGFEETEFLSFYCSRISLEESCSLEWNSSIHLFLYECTCNTKFDCIRL